MSLDRYRPGEIYEVTPNLANYLVAEGFAAFERREDHPQPAKKADRRKPK